MYRPLGTRWRDDEEDEDEETAIDGHDIRLTIKNHSQPSTEYIYYTIQPGDTLHNISVRFSCPVAALKRLNNIWSDQEIHGLTRLKLPVGKLRLITDLIDEPPNSSIDGPRQSLIAPQLPPNLDEIHQDGGGGDQLFKNVDTNIESARRAASSYDNHASEIMQSLAQSGNLVASDVDYKLDPKRIAQREAETLLNDMTDYGLSYNGLILFVFIVCLICPLAYVIYLEETHHETISTNKPHATTQSLSSDGD